MTGSQTPREDQGVFNHLLIHLFEQLNLSYAIGGSIAAMQYSESRSTIAIDILFQGDQQSLAQLIDEIAALQVYVDPFETVLEYNIPAKLPISVVDSSTRLKADLYLAQESGLDQSAMSRRRRMLAFDPPIEAWFLAPEDVILYKLDYFKQSGGISQKHPIDIAKMLGVIGNELDLDYMEQWSTNLGVSELWQALWNEFHRD